MILFIFNICVLCIDFKSVFVFTRDVIFVKLENKLNFKASHDLFLHFVGDGLVVVSSWSFWLIVTRVLLGEYLAPDYSMVEFYFFDEMIQDRIAGVSFSCPGTINFTNLSSLRKESHILQ